MDGSVVWVPFSEKLYPEPRTPERYGVTGDKQFSNSALPLVSVAPWDVLSGDTSVGTEQDLCPGVTGKPIEMTEMLGTSQGEALPPPSPWEWLGAPSEQQEQE